MISKAIAVEENFTIAERHCLKAGILTTGALQVLFALAMLSVMACSQHKNQTVDAKQQEKKFSAPKTTLLSQLPEKDKPKTILLDTAPKPSVVNVTIKDVEARLEIQRHLAKVDTSAESIVDQAKGIGFFETFTTDDGLSLDQVNCSYKDRWGNLWFGTNGGGISKYDGKNFTNYTTAHGLASNVIWCITQDHDDNLWFGTDGGGVSKYNGESFTNYSTTDGLCDNVIFSIVEDKKYNMWFGSLKGGVSKWDKNKFVSYSTQQGLANNTVKAILEDRKGSLWFGTYGGGVSKWDGNVFSNYTMKEGLVSNKIWSIAEDTSGNLWFGTEGKGLSKYDGNEFISYPVFREAFDDAVVCMTTDKRGTLWCGTQKTGVIKYDGKNFTRYSTVNGFVNNQARAVTVDEKENLWFSSFGGGICKFAGNSFTNFTTAQGLASNVIFSVAEDRDGKLWLGTSGGGVCRYDGSRFTNFTKADGLPDSEIFCVFKDHSENLWLGTAGGGVVKYDGKTFINYTTKQGLANRMVFTIAEDKKGNIWFGTSGGGVSKFDGKSFTNYTTLQGLAGNVVFSIREDNDSNLWFGTLDGGVSKFDGAGFTNYTVEQGLADDVVWTITEDRQGNLWFGTQHGLCVMSKEKSKLTSLRDTQHDNNSGHLFTSFTTEDGLPNNFITQVVQGADEKLYIGTNLGMCELLPAKGQTSLGKAWSVGRIFNTQHGYPVKDVNAGLNAMFTDSKGVIWVATGSDKTGLVRFEPGALMNSSSQPPSVFINQLKVNNEDVSWRDIDASTYNGDLDSVSRKAIGTEEMSTYGKKLTDSERDSIRSRFADIRFDSITKWQSLPQNLVLPYYFNNVSFNFGAIETGKSFLVNYKYFLEGYNKDWSPPGRNTYVNFGNINEGDYVFKVKAQSPEGIWSQPVSYKFTVLPPWWRTWWMFAVYAILIVAIIFLFSRWKHKQIIYQKKILAQKVTIATKQVMEETQKVKEQKRKIEHTLNELKETQAQLIQSEKMASLGELTAGIAHEIQNPLNFVNNFSEVNKELLAEMKEEIDRGNIDEVKAIANDVIDNEEKINQHGKRADAIVKGMLQHSRTSSGQKEPVEINTLVDEYLRLAYHGLRAKDNSFNTALKTSYDESIGSVNIVRQDIGRVILNLLTNAFHIVDEKKKQGIDGYEPTVFVTTQKTNDRVEIKISDNGNGIPENIKDKIFQPFFTTKPPGQGTGLGLSLSYDITKAHGGELKVETKEGEGAEFSIILPG